MRVTPAKRSALAPAKSVTRAILVLRGQRVLLDAIRAIAGSAPKSSSHHQKTSEFATKFCAIRDRPPLWLCVRGEDAFNRGWPFGDEAVIDKWRRAARPIVCAFTGGSLWCSTIIAADELARSNLPDRPADPPPRGGAPASFGGTDAGRVRTACPVAHSVLCRIVAASRCRQLC
jgi:hypothetical protein